MDEICFKLYSITLKTMYNNCLILFKITFSVIVVNQVSWKQILRWELNTEGFLGEYSQKEGRIGRREKLTHRAAALLQPVGSSGSGKALLSSPNWGKGPRPLYPYSMGQSLAMGCWRNGRAVPWCQGKFPVMDTIVSNWCLEFSCKSFHFKAFRSLTCIYIYL